MLAFHATRKQKARPSMNGALLHFTNLQPQDKSKHKRRDDGRVRLNHEFGRFGLEFVPSVLVRHGDERGKEHLHVAAVWVRVRFAAAFFGPRFGDFAAPEESVIVRMVT